MPTNEELYHHGVKGMKWGVRRTAEQLGHVAKKAGRAIKREADKVKEKRKESRARKGKLTRREIENMSDDELRKVTNRLKLEADYVNSRNNYIDAMSRSGFASKGKKATSEAMLKSYGSIVEKVAYYGMAKAVNAGRAEEIVPPKKKDK